VASGHFRDAEGRQIRLWDPGETDVRELPEQVLDELDALRAEVAELSERVEFTERLLSQPRRDLE
jgi:hypothetical protein